MAYTSWRPLRVIWCPLTGNWYYSSHRLTKTGQKKDLDFCCLLSAVQAFGLIMCGMLSWHTFSLLIPTECRVNTTAYLGIDADRAHLFMTTVFKSETGLLNMAIDSKVTRSQYNTQLFDAVVSLCKKSQRNDSSTLLSLCYDEWRQFWRHKGSSLVLATCN